jgi:hypothetical protein
MKDQEHPFFRPLWRRIAIVVFCGAWAAWEYYNQQEFWGMLALGMTAYAVWVYLWTYPSPEGDANAEPEKKE